MRSAGNRQSERTLYSDPSHPATALRSPEEERSAMVSSCARSPPSGHTAIRAVCSVNRPRRAQSRAAGEPDRVFGDHLRVCDLARGAVAATVVIFTPPRGRSYWLRRCEPEARVRLKCERKLYQRE